MKNRLTTLILVTFLTCAYSAAWAQDFQIPHDLDTDRGVVTDIDQAQFSDITDIKNNEESDAKQQLSNFVKNIKSASGQFAQQIKGNAQKNTQQTGSFSFERPGKFVWHVTKPYEQHVISDGKTLYQYDPDLKQVTVRKVNEALGASPVSILFGSGSLEQSFTVEVLPEKNSMVWLRATPKVADAGMKYIDVAFANNLPTELNVLDSFGKNTSIKLRNLKTNVKIPGKLFQFTAPPGVDTVKM